MVLIKLNLHKLKNEIKPITLHKRQFHMDQTWNCYKKTAITLQDTGSGKDFQNLTSVTQELRSETNKWDLINLKKLLYSKGNNPGTEEEAHSGKISSPILWVVIHLQRINIQNSENKEGNKRLN